MRLWTLHPEYLDRQGLVALWREAPLAKAVLEGKTRGYRRHPQLERFDRRKIGPPRRAPRILDAGVQLPKADEKGAWNETRVISSAAGQPEFAQGPGTMVTAGLVMTAVFGSPAKRAIDCAALSANRPVSGLMLSGRPSTRIIH